MCQTIIEKYDTNATINIPNSAKSVVFQRTHVSPVETGRHKKYDRHTQKYSAYTSKKPKKGIKQRRRFLFQLYMFYNKSPTHLCLP